MKKIYMLEDNATKRSFLQDFIKRLNEDLPENETPFVDGFDGRAEEALLEPYTLIAAAEDTEGICLVDQAFKEDIYRETGRSIQKWLRDQGRTSELVMIEKIKDAYHDDPLPIQDYWLSSIVLAICHERRTRCLITSTVAGGIALDRLRHLGFHHVLPPYDEGSKSKVEDVVEAIKGKWFKDSWLTLDDFLKHVESLSHQEIQDEGLANDTLRRFFRLRDDEFLEEFGSGEETDVKHQDAVRGEVVDALKTISGLTDKIPKDHDYQGRPMALNGAWILALGTYRRLFPKNDWKRVFNTTDLACAKHKSNIYPNAHPRQKAKEVRRRTLQLFARMCEILFADKKNRKNSTLESVKLEQNSLKFFFNFPAERLHERIAWEARRACGEDGVEVGRDSSGAIWRFWAATSFTDTPTEDTGVFGSQPRLNVFKAGEGKTEVRFGG